MLVKIPRDECLKRYPMFPLRHYDEAQDEDIFFYPEVFSGQWMKLDDDKSEDFYSKLAKALSALLLSLGVDELIVLGDTDQSWISKEGLKRKDYPAFRTAVEYFIQHQVDTYFNGGVVVSNDELETFFLHFYTLTSCDASLPYFHFIDSQQRFLGAIHYSGQIRIDRFNEQADQLVDRLLAKTAFRDAGR